MQTPPAATSQADKIAKFKELLAKARQPAAPNPADAGNGQSPEAHGGPVNPATAPVTGVPESISYFLNKMRLLEDLSADEKTELEALYKELGNTEQPDPELSSLLNQYNGLFPTGSTASSGADQAGASADAADADMGAAMRSGTRQAARATADAADGPSTGGPGMPNANTAAQVAAAAVQDTEDAYPKQSYDPFGNPVDQGSQAAVDPSGNQVTDPKDIPPQADKKVPFWIKGKRYVYKTIRGTASWFPEDIGYFAGAGPKETADKLIKQQYTGSQADVPTSESVQHNSENQRLRELAGIAEAVAPVTKNAPDYPTNQVKADTRMMTQNLSGGLNGAKTTGQTTTPVVASQVKRLHSHVSEGQRMVDLYKTISAIENKEG